MNNNEISFGSASHNDSGVITAMSIVFVMVLSVLSICLNAFTLFKISEILDIFKSVVAS